MPSDSCCFFPCFLHRRKSVSDRVQTQRNFTEIFLDQKEQNGLWLRLGVALRRTQPILAPLVGCAHLRCPQTASLLYKYPNIPETLGESKKINSSHHRVQNHQIQSRHHHGGVHHFHCCLSDDVWVVLCRPSGPELVARWLPLSRLILNTMVSWGSIWCNSFCGVFAGIRSTLSLWSDISFYIHGSYLSFFDLLYAWVLIASYFFSDIWFLFGQLDLFILQ